MRKFTSVIVQILFFIVALIIIGGISYIIGFSYLEGSKLQGNDTTAFFTITEWISRFYPKIPYWFPLQGSGVSFDGYPWFSALIVNFIAYYSQLNLVQSFRLVGFLSVPLTGLGVFLFCWTRLTSIKELWQRQIVGIIAGFFSVVAPASWIWLAQWGFYADQVSVIFVPYIILFFDLFIERLFNKKFDFYFRLGFVGTLIFWLLGFLTHFFIGVGTITIFLMIIVFKFIFQKENKMELLKRLVLPLSIFFIALTGIVAFRYYSYSYYSKSVAHGGFTGLGNPIIDREGTRDRLQTVPILLSLKNPIEIGEKTEMRSTIKDMRFPFYVWLGVIMALIFGFLKSKRIFVFALFTLIGFAANTNVDFYIFFQNVPIIKSIPIISNIPTTFMGRLFFAEARVLTPIASAFGLYAFWEVLLSKFTKRSILVATLTVLTFLGLFYKFYNTPYDRFAVNTGTYLVDLRDIWRHAIRPMNLIKTQYKEEEWKFLEKNKEYLKYADYSYLNSLCIDNPIKNKICDYYRNSPTSKFPPLSNIKLAQSECAKKLNSEFVGDYKYCNAIYLNIFDQLNLKRWRPLTISGDMSDDLLSLQKFFNDLPNNTIYRYDVSGFAGKTLQSTNLVNNGSQMQIYMGTLSLIFNAWNYQAQMMYSNYPIYQKDGVLTEIGKWWGLNYVYLTGTPLEPIDFWNRDTNWEKINVGDKGWRKFNFSTGQATLDLRSKILVISDSSKFFYDNTFKFFTRGGLLYDEGIPVEGGKFIDDYSIEKLRTYEAVFMRAYGYKNKTRAYKLLNDYVKNGGKLIFDTGWQYNIPDYQIDKAPEFMPFDNLAWKNLDPNAKFEINDESLSQQVDVSKMGDLKYEDIHSWGVSSPSKVRSWGKVLMSVQNSPLVITGNFGKGKVLWFGFNLIPHSESKDSMEEVKLFNILISGLLGEKKTDQYNLEVNRSNPDFIEFRINDSINTPSNLFFRESYFPSWKAKLVSNNKISDLGVERAGPGFMLINLPAIKQGDKVILKIEESVGQKVANGVSIITCIMLIAYLFTPKIFEMLGAKIPKPKFNPPQFKVRSLNEDQEY